MAVMPDLRHSAQLSPASILSICRCTIYIFVLAWRKTFTIYMSFIVRERALQDEFWLLVLESLGSLQLGPICARHLRAWIVAAVRRMRLENRLTPRDLRIARANLISFIEIMKAEAFILGRADQVDSDSFEAALRQIERHARLTAFNLWPFWPKRIAQSN